MARRNPSRRPVKHDGVLEKTRACLMNGRYSFTPHAQQRMRERSVIVQELLEAIQGPSGFHEKRKDDFSLQHQAWNYALRGKTNDGRKLRITVALERGIVVVTVIDLDREYDGGD